ncbi:hypothetical protein SFRURICE_002893 [Spodoptera frugiperda]|nr:hypothetical protein SFRURICE_002893 [Spodoptera frugiperda]
MLVAFIQSDFHEDHIIYIKSLTANRKLLKANPPLIVLKSFVTTSYALDSTLHAICYHHVENQRGSLVKQHCLSTHDFACSFRRQYY